MRLFAILLLSLLSACGTNSKLGLPSNGQSPLSRVQQPVDHAKIDDSGHYLPFSGVTVVAAVGRQNREFFEKFHSQLAQEKSITDHISLLPVDSYHMTTINLYTQSGQSNKTWGDFINGHLDWFQDLRKSIDSTSFMPHIAVEEATVPGYALLILVRLAENEAKIIKDTAIPRQLENQIPGVFHITVGYVYSGSVEQANLIQEKANSILKNLLSQRQSSEFTLESPKLCYFNDMLAFIPWNGIASPFNLFYF